MKAPLLHAPNGRVRVDSIVFMKWILPLPTAKKFQAARVARYLETRANRSLNLENKNADFRT
jgi:hypothetical protein